MKGEIIGSIFFTLVFLAVLFFTGCKITQDVQRSKAEKYYRNNPDEFAQLAAEKFPATKSTIKIDTVYIQADMDSAYNHIINTAQDWIQRTQEQTYEDTTAAGIKYRADLQEAKNIIASLSAHKLNPDTVRIEKEIEVADTKMIAANESLSDENAALKNKIDEVSKSEVDWKMKARKRNWALIIIGSVIGLSFVGWLVSKFKTINIKK